MTTSIKDKQAQQNDGTLSQDTAFYFRFHFVTNLLIRTIMGLGACLTKK